MGVSTVRLSGESPTRRLSMSKGPPPINFSTRLALRPAECAVALGVCERTLRRWMRDERLPFFRVERGVFIPSAELERWMHDRIESEQATTETCPMAVTAVRQMGKEPHNQARNTLRALVLHHRPGVWQQTNCPTSRKSDPLKRNRAHSLARNQGD